MTDTEYESLHKSNSSLTPVYISDTLSTLSVGHLLSNKEEALIWRGQKKNGLIKQFLRDVDYAMDDEKVDFLVLDTPPGTSDEHLSIVSFLKEVGITGTYSPIRCYY